MKTRLPALLLCLAGCASEVEPAPSVGVLRQASSFIFDGTVSVTGSAPLAHLGTALASCPTGGYVAGAPGDDSVWLSPLGLRLAPPRMVGTEVVPYPLACLFAGGPGYRVLVGGPTGYALQPDGGAQPISTTRVDSLDTAPGAWLALGAVQPGTVSLYPNNNIVLNNPSYVTSPAATGLGVSVAWTKRGELVVGNRAARSASLYLPDLTVDGGAFTALPVLLPNPFPAQTTSEFGAVVAAGNVYPDPGDEYIVGAPTLGKVFIFSGTFLVMTLSGTGTSFGSALAVDPRDAGGGLQSLWVGEPEIGAVYRFFGDSSTQYTAPNSAFGSSFGQAVAVDQQGVVAIGAPRFSATTTESGAVFETTNPLPFLDGVAQVCTPGTSCPLPSCNTGTCLGGVFCERTNPTGSNCSANETCVGNLCVPILPPADGGPSVDAGSADAGFPDASFPDASFPDASFPDAGFPDAGFPDAGSADAGSADAGFFDAGMPDAGSFDAGVRDAGTDAGTRDGGFADAGRQDAGAEDAGAEDAGAEDAGAQDAGTADAGSKDAGPDDGGFPKDAGAASDGGTDEELVFRSCGCSSGGLPVLLLGLIFARRRRSFSSR